MRRTDDPPGIGKRILVEGKPATRCIGRGNGHYVYFMRDGLGNDYSVTLLCDGRPMERKP